MVKAFIEQMRIDDILEQLEKIPEEIAQDPRVDAICRSLGLFTTDRGVFVYIREEAEEVYLQREGDTIALAKEHIVHLQTGDNLIIPSLSLNLYFDKVFTINQPPMR